MLDFFITTVLLLELILLIVICFLLVPLRRFPGVRAYYWLGATAGGASAVTVCLLAGLFQRTQPVRTGIFLFGWIVIPALWLALVFDLQGASLGVFPLQKRWKQLVLPGIILWTVVTGFLFGGSGVWMFLTWAFGSGILMYGMARFLLGHWQALSRYQAFLIAITSLLVVSGLMWVWGLWGFSWDGISLIFTSLLLFAAGKLFLEQRGILRKLGDDQRRQAHGTGENWFLLDPAGRILDFDGNGLALLKWLRGEVKGRKIHQVLPQMGKALCEIEANQRLDVDMEDDFFGTTRLCRFSLFFPLRMRTIFEPRIIKIRALPAYETGSQGQNAAGNDYEDLQRQMTLMQTAWDAFTQGIMITDYEGRVLYRNQILINLLDLSDEALKIDDTEWKEKISRRTKDPDRLKSFIGQILDQEVGETLDILECSDGRLLEVRTRYYYADALGGGFRLWEFSDCTEQQRRERELQHMGMHDTLTGIYNRAFFEMKLRQLRLVSLYPVAMFMVDVDGLKHVNDYQGHSTGDQVLRQAAYILRQACRTDDIVARLGGDEFGVLLAHADQVIAEQVAVRIQGLLNMYNIRHPDVPVSISMGYAVAEDPKEMETLFPRADDAMYESRRKHRAGQNLPPTL